jgi:hypothetical protein
MEEPRQTVHEQTVGRQSAYTGETGTRSRNIDHHLTKAEPKTDGPYALLLTASFRELGPPDLCHVIKTTGRAGQKDVSPAVFS